MAVTSELPWPLDSGGHLRTFHLLQALSRRSRIRLVTGVADGSDEFVEATRAAGIDVIAARVGHRRAAREVVRAIKAFAAGEAYVFYRRHDRSQMRRAIAEAVRHERPDILYLDHLDSMLFVDSAPGAKVVADLHNVYSMLVERMASEQGSVVRRLYLTREARLLRRAERSAAQRADVVMTVSALEGEYYRQLGARRMALVPNGVDCALYANLPAGRQVGDAPVVLFIGGLAWLPNVAAVRYLVASVLPQVRREYPRAAVRVVGRIAPDLRAELNAFPGVEVVGEVPDVRPYLSEATVVAVPLESGGGTRLKILEAFAAGVPVVSTPIGCEGIAVEHGRQLVIAEREEFPSAIIALLGDPERAAAMAQTARQLAVDRYDWKVVGGLAVGAVLDSEDRQ